MSDESADEERHIPKALFKFVQHPKNCKACAERKVCEPIKYQEFLQTLLEYCKELFRLENKQQVLE